MTHVHKRGGLQDMTASSRMYIHSIDEESRHTPIPYPHYASENQKESSKEDHWQCCCPVESEGCSIPKGLSVKFESRDTESIILPSSILPSTFVPSTFVPSTFVPSTFLSSTFLTSPITQS